MLVTLHLVVLSITAIGVLLADHMGFQWIRGVKPTLDAKKLKRYHYWVGGGLTGMIITGFFLFIPNKDFLLTHPQFIVKMMFVAFLVINAFAISELLNVATTRTFASLTFKEKIPLFISGGISTMCWLGAAAGGFFLY